MRLECINIQKTDDESGRSVSNYQFSLVIELIRHLKHLN